MRTDRTGLAIMAAGTPMPLVIAAMIVAGSGSGRATTTNPNTRPPTTLSIPVPARASVENAGRRYSRAELRCLARAVYYEAGLEPVEGQIAVAEVVIARSQDRRWRGDLCHTIRIPNQFSFVKGGRTIPIPDAGVAQRTMDLVRDVAAGRIASRAKGALFYHADYARPSWRHGLTRKIRIRTHIFYTDRIDLT